MNVSVMVSLLFASNVMKFASGAKKVLSGSETLLMSSCNPKVDWYWAKVPVDAPPTAKSPFPAEGQAESPGWSHCQFRNAAPTDASPEM